MLIFQCRAAQLDMNNRKEETGQELQALDKKVMVHVDVVSGVGTVELTDRLLFPAGPEQQVYDAARRGAHRSRGDAVDQHS